MFNGGEVNFLTIKHEGIFHIFQHEEVVDVFVDNFEIINSQARRSNETPEQKVLFRYNEKNIAELEIRNSGENHYKEVLLVMNKLKTIELLREKITNVVKTFNNKVYVYGKANKKFKHEK
jgi:hypothetical protein